MTYKRAQQEGFTLTEKELVKFERGALKNLKEAQKQINKELQAIYLKFAEKAIQPEEYYNYLTKQTRLERLLKEIDRIYVSSSLKNSALTVESGKLAMSNLYYRQLYNAQWVANSVFVVLPDELIQLSVTGRLKDWQAISQRTKDRIANTFGDVVQYQPRYGSLSEILVNNRRNTIVKLERQLTSGFISGDSYRKQVKTVAKIMDTDYNSALNVLRTEGTRTMNAGAYANTNAIRAQGIKAERIWDATLDSRVRQTHSGLDGKPENKDGKWCIGGDCAPYPGQFGNVANNARCRCSAIDLIDGVSPLLRRARDPLTGETDIISYKNFDAWAKENDLVYNKSGRLVAQ